jgi:undecaprenyl-diphosphatase
VCHPVVNAIIKGFLEGFTEFLPISSTGHLILVRHLFPLTVSTQAAEIKRVDDLFDIVVQFPAILAIMILYRRRLWTAACGVREKPEARRFWLGLFLAFLPAAAAGWCFHDQIKERLFNPVVIAWALIAGGVVLLLADRKTGEERVARAEETPLGRAFAIGLCQCLALVPGTSRSGATIVGGRFLSLTREAAAEYSFFLALPTMGAACVYEFAKSLRDIQWATDGPVLLAGSLTSFVTAWIVVALFIRFLQKHGLGVFGYYRIVLGLLVLWLGRALAVC